MRLFGDLVAAAFIGGEKPKEREGKLGEYASAVASGEAERYRGLLEAWRHAEQPLVPFHWELEFPEVFERENSGFDAIVGNPPFLGGKHIAPALGDSYAQALKTLISGKKGSADLSAYFLLRAHGMLRTGGAAGLVGTSTIAEGDTREVGLASLIAAGNTVYSATSSSPWPGTASVHYITVAIAKGVVGRKSLDGLEVPFINSRLRPRAEEGEPSRLVLPAVPSSGSSLLGQGFILTSSDREALSAVDPKSGDVIKPFMNGEDFVRRADMSPSRFAIDFGEMTLNEAARYPAALDRLTQLVKPQRDRLTRQIHEECYWRHWDKRKELYKALEDLERTLVFPLVSKFVVFGFINRPAKIVFSHKLGVFPSAETKHFTILQSRCHGEWVSKYSSSRGETINYSVSDCLSTFPFPKIDAADPALDAAGKSYYDFRAALMVRKYEGLTKTYNRFHHPDERDPETETLRELHAAMDRAVLDAYGWSDIPADCKFLLDYEIDEGEWGTKKKPWRYRWPDEVRDEVLARLLELNAERAEEESRSGTTAPKRGMKGSIKQAESLDSARLFS